jgi:hypothetical protein
VILLGKPIDSIPGWTRLRIRARKEPDGIEAARRAKIQPSIGVGLCGTTQEFKNWRRLI